MPPTDIADPEIRAEEHAAELAAEPALGARFFNARTLISFALGFAIILFLITRVQIDIGAIFDRIRQSNPLLLAAALVVFYGTFPIRALRWRRLLHNVGMHEHAAIELPSVLGLAEIVFLSWFANCIVPAKLGDAYRAYLLKVNAGVSFSMTIGTIVAERIIDVLVLFLLMAAAASLAFGRALPPEITVLMQIGFVLVVAVAAGLIGLRRLRPLVLKVLPERVHAQYDRFEHGTLASFRGMPAVLALTAGSWACEVARLALVTLALGLTGVAPSVLLFVALASALATTLPLTPAGLGFAEGTIVAIFLLASRAGLAPGVDEHTAASIALLDRGISYWSLILLGLVVYPLSRRK
jgi:glycosyltransferase 2 family protein